MRTQNLPLADISLAKHIFSVLASNVSPEGVALRPDQDVANSSILITGKVLLLTVFVPNSVTRIMNRSWRMRSKVAFVPAPNTSSSAGRKRNKNQFPPRRDGSARKDAFSSPSKSKFLSWQGRSLWVDGHWLENYRLPAKTTGAQGHMDSRRPSHSDGLKSRTNRASCTLRRRRCTVRVIALAIHAMSNTTPKTMQKMCG